MRPSLLKKIARRIKSVNARFTSGRGREVGLFFVFVCVAAGFWLMLTLNNETQEVVEIPLSIEGVPDSVTILSDIPRTIKVNVHDKGSALLRSRVAGQKTMRIEWLDYDAMDNIFRMSKVDILGRLRSFFAPSAQIVNVMPDSLRLVYTTTPGIKVPVRIDADLTPAIGFAVNGPVVVTPDSVTVYATDGIPDDMSYAATAPAVRKDMRDTTHISVRVTPPDGVRAIPDHVTLSVPVEPLIMKRQSVRVEPCNMPADHGMLVFPAVVEISYLLPMSAYKNDMGLLKATVDYGDAVSSDNGMVPVRIPYTPDVYRNVSVSPDSVEYILESKH